MTARTSASNVHAYFHGALATWMTSKFQDQRALESCITQLNELLNQYPNQAEVVQQFALGACYLTKLRSACEAGERLAQIGLDAGLVKAPSSPDDFARLTLTALLQAEAALEQSKPVEGQHRLTYAESLAAQLSPYEVLQPLFTLHLETIRGEFAEAALEYEQAAAHYKAAVEAGEPLLSSPTTAIEVAQRLVAIMYGSGTALIEGGAKQAEDLMREDVSSTWRRALIGRANTDRENALEAARAALDALKHLGFPPDRPPIELRRALLCLSSDEVDEVVNELLVSAEQMKDPQRRSAWILMLRSTQLKVHTAAGKRGRSLNAFAEMGRALPKCNDAVTLAIVFADQITAEPDPSRREAAVEGFLLAYAPVIEHWRNTPLHLPVRAHFDAPIANAIEWVVHQCTQEPRPRLSRQLSALFDSLRTTRSIEVLTQPKTPDRADEALGNALDWFARLRAAMVDHSSCLAVLLQSVGQDTLFLGIPGGHDGNFVCERAGPEYQKAARELAAAMRSEIENPEADGRSRLTSLGQAAFAAIPQRIRELIEGREILLLCPDFVSDQNGVPFELLHDERDFIGLTMVVSRFRSLRNMISALESNAVRGRDSKRALCIAISPVEGLPELFFAEAEVNQLRASFKSKNWQSPAIVKEKISSDFLLEAGELASVVHIAAHGEIFAGGETLVLPGGKHVSAADIERWPRPLQSFVYLNACSLGSSRYLGGGVSRGIAYALSDAGVPCVLANLTPIQDRSASLLSEEFYRAAGRESVGESLRRARRALSKKGVSPALWATTVCIGNPMYRLSHLRKSAPAEVAAELLNRYTSVEATDVERRDAYSRAMEHLLKRPDDVRLKAAVAFVQLSAEVTPGKQFGVEYLEKIAKIAEQLNHAEGEALIRYAIVKQTEDGSDQSEYAIALDRAIAVLDHLSNRADHWYRMRLEFLAERRRVKLEAISPQHTDDKIIEAFQQIKLGVEEQEERRRGQVELRRPERGLEDIAWNAVVVGSQTRFRDLYSKGAFAWFFAEKLSQAKVITAEVIPNARRMAGGLLCFLWDSQKITHLEPEMADGQTGTLCGLIESLKSNWSPPEVSPGSALVSPIAERLDSLSKSRSESKAGKYARALRAVQGEKEADNLGAIERSIEAVVASATKVSAACAADCAAWLIGLLAEKSYTLSSQGEEARTLARSLEATHASLMERAEGWYFPYLMTGFQRVREGSFSVLDEWRNEPAKPRRLARSRRA
jgi:CHAT domain-containing protein/tetratricopeptide (TPR) repeat protein